MKSILLILTMIAMGINVWLVSSIIKKKEYRYIYIYLLPMTILLYFILGGLATLLLNSFYVVILVCVKKLDKTDKGINFLTKNRKKFSVITTILWAFTLMSPQIYLMVRDSMGKPVIRISNEVYDRQYKHFYEREPQMIVEGTNFDVKFTTYYINYPTLSEIEIFDKREKEDVEYVEELGIRYKFYGEEVYDAKKNRRFSEEIDGNLEYGYPLVTERMDYLAYSIPSGLGYDDYIDFSEIELTIKANGVKDVFKLKGDIEATFRLKYQDIEYTAKDIDNENIKELEYNDEESIHEIVKNNLDTCYFLNKKDKFFEDMKKYVEEISQTKRYKEYIEADFEEDYINYYSALGMIETDGSLARKLYENISHLYKNRVNELDDSLKIHVIQRVGVINEELQIVNQKRINKIIKEYEKGGENAKIKEKDLSWLFVDLE